MSTRVIPQLRVFVSLAVGVSLFESIAGMVVYRHLDFEIAPLLVVVGFSALYALAGAVLAALAAFSPRHRLAAGAVFGMATLSYVLPIWYSIFRTDHMRFKALASLAVLVCAVVVSGVVVGLLWRVLVRWAPGATLLALVVAIGVGLSSAMGEVAESATPGAESFARTSASVSPPQTIVVLTFDSLRADHLSAYGYGRPTSPELDDFFARSLRFKNARPTRGRTAPSLGSMLTGVFPPKHGLMYNGWSLAGVVKTLPDLLDSRYRRAAFIGNPVVGPGAKSAGFDHIEVLEYPKAEELLGQASKWIAAQGDSPVFVWVHLFEPHSSYKPPEADLAPFLKDMFYDVAARRPYNVDLAARKLNLSGKSPAEVRQVVNETMAAYDGSIRYATRAAAAFLDEVEKMRPDPLIVVGADHGESMVEHDYFFLHGEYSYEPTLRVPLAFHYAPSNLTGTSRVPASLVDVLPTVCAFAGCGYLPENDGIDLIAAHQASLLSRSVFFASLNNPLYNRWAVARDHQKLILSPRRAFAVLDGLIERRSRLFSCFGLAGTVNPYRNRIYRVELYDLIADPGEINNLAAKKPALARALASELMNFLDQQHASDDGPLNEQVVTPKMEERLRAMGYIE